MSRPNVTSKARIQCIALRGYALDQLGLIVGLMLLGLLAVFFARVQAAASPHAVIEVKLTNSSIEMPATAPPGPMTFSVTNTGTVAHNFVIEGNGIKESFPTVLKAGETRNLQVDLPVGTYSVSCSADESLKPPVQVELKVAPQHSRAGAITPAVRKPRW